MSNNFPSPPTDVQLHSITYTLNFGDAVIGAGPSLTFDGTSTSMFGAIVGLGSSGGIVFSFDTAGDFGTFDQTSAETAMAKISADIFQLISDLTGITIATLMQGFCVNRAWTWTDADGNECIYTDAMPLPAAQ